MDKITEKSRLESFLKTSKSARQLAILKALSVNGPMTAREVAKYLGVNDRQYTAPRLTELKEHGLVVTDGTRYDTDTERNVTLWKVNDQNHGTWAGETQTQQSFAAGSNTGAPPWL